MSRYQKLDPERILEAAEALIREDGAHTLSIRNVAAKCGVSKGGVQSNFGTVDKLIESLFDKWGSQMDALIDEERQSADAGASETKIFLKASRRFHFSNPERNAALMILMTQSAERRAYAQGWLRQHMQDIDASDAAGRRERLYFMIIESLLATKSMELTALDDQTWREIFDDLDTLFGE